ncbi:hypothetical protein EWM64_g6802 [Hericium alpestre]|uniref:Uncharacterized protein n=1 Tax=Hericium alpestre TaxID=135208 RepID=A0A4Y9ZTR0_9AGAM|nr:hypothetical protein EWM64_g6802 [Hericium alpestre]
MLLPAILVPAILFMAILLAGILLPIMRLRAYTTRTCVPILPSLPPMLIRAVPIVVALACQGIS